MSQTFQTIWTLVGQFKLAEALATGTPLRITEMAVGDADYTPTSGATSLVNEVWRGPLVSSEVNASNSNWLEVRSTIVATVGDFTIREVGLFDEDGDLVVVSKYPETYKPILSGGSTIDLDIILVTEIQNADSVEIVIDATVAIASVKWVLDEIEKHRQETNPHPNLVLRDEIARATAIYAAVHAAEALAVTGANPLPYGFGDDFTDASGVDGASTGVGIIGRALAPRLQTIQIPEGVNWGGVTNSFTLTAGSIAPKGTGFFAGMEAPRTIYSTQDFTADFSIRFRFAGSDLPSEGFMIGVVDSTAKATLGTGSWNANQTGKGVAAVLRIAPGIEHTTIYNTQNAIVDGQSILTDAGAYALNDVFEIHRVGSSLRFIKNGVEIYRDDSFDMNAKSFFVSMDNNQGNAYPIDQIEYRDIGPIGDMDYISVARPLDVTAARGRIQFAMDDIASVTLGTTVSARLSADDGVTWDGVTVSRIQDLGDGVGLYAGEVDFTAPGSVLRAGVQSSGGADFRIIDLSAQAAEF